jgi:predicted Zn-dependent protease
MSMNRREFLILTGLGAAAAAAGCTTNPYTGREQLMLVPSSRARELGHQARSEILKKEPITKDPRYTGPVIKSGTRIAAVVDRPGYDWEFHVVDKPDTVNAFALPGGYVFVYTGLFDLAGGEAQLATVIGHEIAHVIARHGSERMSMGIVSEMGRQLAATALGGGSQSVNAFMVAFGIGANVGVILPYSRIQEYEADEIGVRLMARAGYDPRNALEFWAKMAKKDGKKPPAFLSTHPADEDRIENIRAMMPEAMQIYRRNT